MPPRGHKGKSKSLKSKHPFHPDDMEFVLVCESIHWGIFFFFALHVKYCNHGFKAVLPAAKLRGKLKTTIKKSLQNLLKFLENF